MTVTFRLLREALHHLSLEPDEQRSALPAFVDLTFELADDLDNAVRSLAYTQEAEGVRLRNDVVAELQRLNAMFKRPAGDPVWEDHALDRHETWAEARRVARELLPLLPGQSE